MVVYRNGVECDWYLLKVRTKNASQSGEIRYTPSPPYLTSLKGKILVCTGNSIKGGIRILIKGGILIKTGVKSSRSSYNPSKRFYQHITDVCKNITP